MRGIAAISLWLLAAPALAQAIGPPSAPAPSTAQPISADIADIVDLAPVQVAVRGPGLWRVSSDGHVLWILGTLAPLPKRMDWPSREVEGVIAQAQEVIQAPDFEITPRIGVLGKLTLLPAAMGARRNPGGAMLRDLVPATEYARWQALKARHLGNDSGVEAYRPIFAAGTLYREAIDDAGLSYRNPVQSTVARLARRHGVRVTEPKVLIEVRRPKQALRAFRQQAIEDGDCFARTLDRIERGFDAMRELADAWSVGDLEAMRALPGVSAQYEACAGALDGAAVARELGLDNLRARKQAAWLAAVERALSVNEVTVALLPVGDLLESGGPLAVLRTHGYEVEDPDSRVRLAEADSSPLAAELSP
jgi:hypothetical protein